MRTNTTTIATINTIAAVVLLLAGAISGCGTRGTTTVAAAAPKPPSSPDPETIRLPLGERLAREARARPAGTVTSEQVLAALERGGVTLARKRQVLASPLGAAYCAAALTSKGLGLALCEFPAADVARRGLEYSRQSFDRLIPGRRLMLNGKTLLTLTGASAAGPEAAAEARAAAAIFASL